MFQPGRRAFPPSTWAWKAGKRGADCLAQLTVDRIWCRCGVGSARACAARVTTVRSEKSKELSPERTRSGSTAPAGPASSLVWRPRTEHDPAQRWLRDTCARLPSASTPDRPTAPGNMGRRPRRGRTSDAVPSASRSRRAGPLGDCVEGSADTGDIERCPAWPARDRARAGRSPGRPARPARPSRRGRLSMSYPPPGRDY